MEIGGINLLMSPEDDDLLLIHVKEFLYMDDLSFYVNCVHSLVYVDDNCQISYGSIVLEMTENLSRAVFPKVIFTQIPNCFRKIPTDPHILAHVNKDRPNDRYPELEMYI